MQPHGSSISEIRLPDDDGDRTASHCVAEYDIAGGRARVERHRGFARHDERANRIIGKAGNRICLNPDYALFTCDGVGNHISPQHRRQSVETFDRQDKYRFACCGDENRPSSVEFAKAAIPVGETAVGLWTAQIHIFAQALQAVSNFLYGDRFIPASFARFDRAMMKTLRQTRIHQPLFKTDAESLASHEQCNVFCATD
jgi:hypothetical protein